MSALLVLALLRTQPKIDPLIAQDWTAAVATGLRSATLSLKSDGRFSMVSVDVKNKRDTIQGTYAVDPAAKAARRRQVTLTYDLASLARAGMPKAEVEALRRRGRTGAVGMQLTYFPDVPVLTDVMTTNFVPIKGKDAALKRLANWKPF